MLSFVEFTKKIIIFSLFTPRPFIRKFINVEELFLRGKANVLSECRHSVSIF